MELIRETHIVFGKNLPLTPRNVKLFTEVKPRRGRTLALNGVVGAPVAFTLTSADEYLTVDQTDIANLKTPLYLGKFIDPNNQGYATDVQLIAGEKMSTCNLTDLFVTKPSCGSPTIKATSIDCVKCHKTYRAMLSIQDNSTISYGQVDVPEQYFATYHPQCASCTDDCDQEANCKDITHGIVDALNNADYPTGPDGEPYPDYKPANFLHNKNWRAVVGHENWNTYCISANDSTDCEGCTTVNKVVSATINGVVKPFVRNVDPSNVTKTLLGQLEDIALQIEDFYETAIGRHAAFAFVTKGVTSCCPVQLHVVTCDPGFVLTVLNDSDVAGPMAQCPIDTDMSYMPQVKWKDCISPATTAVTPACWIAVIAYPKAPDCENCEIHEAPIFGGINIDITFLKDSVSDYGPIISKKTLLEGSWPENTGLQVRWAENQFNEPGGRGRRYSFVNRRDEPYGNLDKTSRWKNVVTAKCDSSYCSVKLTYKQPIDNAFGSGVIESYYDTVLHFDTNDTSTITTVLPLVEALRLKAGSACFALDAVSCS